MSISTKNGCKARYTVFRKLHIKSNKYVSQYSCFKPTLTESKVCTYISHAFFPTEYKKYADVFTVISITMVHKKIKSCLRVHNGTLVQKVDCQNNLRCVELCHFLGQSLHLTQHGMKSASLHELPHIAD